MAKRKVTEVAEELLADFLEREGYELYHSEFVKEGSDWFLRIYIDRPPQPKPAEDAPEPPDTAAASGEADTADTAAASGEADTQYISTDDCEKVSRFLSEALDKADPIEQNYYLEVSSPGMDRPLIKPEHWRRYIGHPIEIRLYRGKDGTKHIIGTLDSYEDGSAAAGSTGAGLGDATAATDDAASDPRITVTDESGKEWNLVLSEIARAKLAVIF